VGLKEGKASGSEGCSEEGLAGLTASKTYAGEQEVQREGLELRQEKDWT
jgi:hypothetical protein